jgi:alanyl-tRNA synthetase
MVEKQVYDGIDQCLPVTTETLPLAEVLTSGAMALFGEKFPKEVRVVTIGDNLSKELCGGEHVKNTMVIKNMKIIGVSSIGSDVKRNIAFGDKFITRKVGQKYIFP